MGAGLIGGLVAFFVGTGLATATVIGVVSTQTAPAHKSPVNAHVKPVIEYGD